MEIYRDYLDSDYGIIEILADNNYVKSVKIVNKCGNPKINKITTMSKNQLNEYFNGTRTNFELPLKFSDNFTDKVYKAIHNNYHGGTITYKELATVIGSSGANRAVGNALAKNPYFIIVPCHRVLRQDGTIGKFLYGSKVKENLLIFEKSKKFNQLMYKNVHFSDKEVEWLGKHQNLNKMFKVMDMTKGLRMFNDPFAAMISNIIYQLVAFKIARQGEVLLFDYLDYNITPERIIKLTDNEFKMLKIYGQRIPYIKNFAQFALDNPNFLKEVDQISEKEIERTLKKISGIGRWSIEMFFIFGLGKKDILSLGDLIIVRGLKNIYGEMSPKELREKRLELLEYGTIISLNLWKYIEEKYYLKH